ncbi:MAG: cell division protein ZapA [Bryobacteraceae bacterium]
MDPGAPEKRQVRVTILSQNYTFLAQGDPREAEELAESVDQLLVAISRKAPNADTTRLAVLGCLHLADRLRALERDLSVLKDRVGRTSGHLTELLEQITESNEVK